ncbi:response regulator [Aeoliella mucimassa]|uniref:CAI-1 autoinducer sensor kinase/phosphatase CqsS n=1 Tax=Aeoliella mucimassa TaxID=2527972 RepID=A0A518AK80_9BACT|nr:response regulator [Aeoliella mucimassa]QDU55096.1 CAI-1 autoinducer sensor kinase/phosphatase CqsS [Aeoliella mucimassa]
MLVFSRRANEKISFPEIGITIHFIRIQSGSAKVGIDAPPQIRIVRDEVDPSQAVNTQLVREEFLRLPREVRHSIRNELHAVSVGVHLLREQLRMNLVDDAQDTFHEIQQSLRRLDENRVLRRPDPSTSNRLTTEDTRTVLLVEDQDNERELLANLLRIKGFSVATVPDGEAALEYLNRHDTPRAILVDMHMPRCDGAATVRQIRANLQHQQAYVFAVSGTSPEENGLEIGSKGVNDWFPKPVNTDLLMEALVAPISAN